MLAVKTFGFAGFGLLGFKVFAGFAATFSMDSRLSEAQQGH